MYALSFGEMFAELREYVNLKVSAATARLFHFTYYTANSANGTEDQVVCDNQEESAGSYLVRRMQHFGFRSRPPKGVAVIRLGNHEAASNSVVIAEESERYGPSDLADGEVAIYNKTTGTEIRIDADGNITIDAGSGADVIVNGGTAKVARVGDTLTTSALLTTWAQAVEVFINGLVPGTISTLWAAGPGQAGSLGDIETGADNFKA